jgi:1-acyl-sn-glycerol-3-phosphate acyltransferase
MKVRVLKGILRAFFSIFTRLRVIGLEHVPLSGPYILAANHMSYFDPPLLYLLLGGDHIAGFVADKYRRNLLFGSIVRLTNPIFIRRGHVDRAALNAAVETLQSGMAFGISPEGTRSRSGTLSKAKTGIALLAELSQAPIVVAAITGTDHATKDLLRLRRPHLSIQFAEPFTLPPIDSEDRNRSLRRNADEVMCRIASMLQPRYHGAYADHPRLVELLESM